MGEIFFDMSFVGRSYGVMLGLILGKDFVVILERINFLFNLVFPCVFSSSFAIFICFRPGACNKR